MLKLKQEVVDILDQIIDNKGCPFLDQSIYGDDCHPNCICKMYSNTDMTCYEIAQKILEKK